MRASWIAAALAALLCMGCGAREREAAAEGGDEQPENQPVGPNPAGLAMMGALMSANLDKPGPYEEPRASAGFQARKPHAVVLELDGPIVELRAFSLLGGITGVELRAVTERLRALAGDEAVRALVLRVGALEASMATAEELRRALLAFKQAGEGRRVLCHAEAAGNVAYFLMTACDDIGLAPGGELTVTGAAAMPIHVKGLLDRLGIEPDFLHVGAFKGAAEPLTRDAPSTEMIETLGGILDRSYASLIAAIAEGRGLPPAKVRELVDRAVFLGEAAMAARLVDRLAIFEAYRDATLEGLPWTRRSLDGGAGTADMTELMRFLGMMPQVRPSGPHVALVYAVGTVVDGKGDGIAGARGQIASRPLAAALRALAADDAVEAIVLRVDSGGGSALASEIIWHAVAEAKAKKPVVVSMGSVAASGGYYIGSGATKIFALDNTLTGSIGVVGGKLALGRALDKAGVKTYPMGRGKRALMGSPMARWTDDERRGVQELMRGIYHTFVGRVAEGRRMKVAEVEAVAQGRVWTGADARERGLVDAIGGLDDALAEARSLASLPADAPLEIYPPNPTLRDVLAGFGNVSAPRGVELGLAELARHLAPTELHAVAELIEQVLLFRDHPVQAALLLPIVVR